MSTFQKAYYGEKNKKVVFLLAGWISKLSTFTPVSKFLAWQGFYCITYAYDPEIFSPHLEETVKKITSVKLDILEEIQRLKKEGKSDFYLFGTSLGATLALMVADESPDISKVILNLTGSNLANVVFKWGEHLNPRFHNYFKEHGISQAKVETAWKPINPQENIEHLHGKELLIYLAKEDRIIPYKYGVDLVEKIKQHGYTYQLVVTSFLDHTPAAMYHFLKFKRWLTFLKTSKHEVVIEKYRSEYKEQVKFVISEALVNLGLEKKKKPSKRDQDLENIEDIYKDRGRFWVALQDNKVIGTIAVENREGDTAHLRRMFVLPEYQGKGVAQKLLNTATEFAKEQGYTQIDLSTAIFMKRAHRFYEKNGFMKTGKSEKEYFYRKTL